MIELDGSRGEGGGQVLRAALSLSMVTGRPFRVTDVRAGRPNPGLRRQHLAAVRGATEISGADVDGDRLGARTLLFRPHHPPRPGRYHLDTGGAGSATLVLETLLPALLDGDAGSRIVVDGGTHNPAAPPYEFLALSWSPLVRRTGAAFDLELGSVGFHPGGGGRVIADVEPGRSPRRLRLSERGEARTVRARAHLTGLPEHIADRELATARAALSLGDDHLEAVLHGERTGGPANVFVLEVESEGVTEVFTEHGRKGLPAEEVASRACRRARRYLEAGVPVWHHLADQLLVPLSLRGGGCFRTAEPTSHTRTVCDVLDAFLEDRPRIGPVGSGAWEVEVSGYASA